MRTQGGAAVEHLEKGKPKRHGRSRNSKVACDYTPLEELDWPEIGHMVDVGGWGGGGGGRDPVT